MRKPLILIVLLCLCIQIQAQKKNEIQIGIPAAYFFDDKSYRFNKPPLITHVNYTRMFTHKNGLSFEYNHLRLNYNDVQLIDTFAELDRVYNKISAEFHRQRKNNRFSVRGGVGLGYRWVTDSFTDNTFLETVFLNSYYDGFAAIISVETKYRLYKNFSIASKIAYSRYFLKNRLNELLNTFALSYEF